MSNDIRPPRMSTLQMVAQRKRKRLRVAKHEALLTRAKDQLVTFAELCEAVNTIQTLTIRVDVMALLAEIEEELADAPRISIPPL